MNDNGGALFPGDFSFSVDGAEATSFVADEEGGLVATSTQTVDAGTYAVTEPEADSRGYSTTYATEQGAAESSNCDEVVVADGGTSTCTITNDDVAGTLIVEKVLTNDNGGTKEVTDFSYTVNGGAAVTFEGDGSNSQDVAAGSYTVVEVEADQDGYTTSYDNCADVVIANGATETCTITNDDEPATPGGSDRPGLGRP